MHRKYEKVSFLKSCFPDAAALRYTFDYSLNICSTPKVLDEGIFSKEPFGDRVIVGYEIKNPPRLQELDLFL